MHRIEVLASAADLDAAAWDGIVATAGAPIFYRHRVLLGYEATRLADQRACAYVLAYAADGRLVAGLPLYLLDGREIFAILGVDVPSGLASHVMLSHFPHCYDTAVPASDPMDLAQLWRVVRAEARRHGARLCGFFNVAAGTSWAHALATTTATPPAPCGARWYLEPSRYGDVDGLLATMARSTRRTLRLAVQRAASAGATVDRTTGVEQDLSDVAALCEATAVKHRNRYYPPHRFGRFLASFADCLTVVRIRLDGDTLAASVCLLDGDVLHCWAGGVRQAKVSNWSPNHVLFHAELTLAFQLGVRRAEFGRRSDEFKARHRLDRLPLLSFLREP